MSYDAIKTLKGMVESVLADTPETRNSDIALTIAIWRRFFPSLVRQEKHHDGRTYSLGEEYVRVKDLFELPREDNVKRVRAMFQNEKKLYLPTSWEVAKGRGLEEDEWRVAMGYPTKETAGTGEPSFTPPSRTDDRPVHKI